MYISDGHPAGLVFCYGPVADGRGRAGPPAFLGDFCLQADAYMGYDAR